MRPSTSRAICLISIVLPFLLCPVSTAAALQPGDYFKITVVDQETGRGVPLVELKTTSGVRYYTDSNGIVAFYEPGLMDQDVYFHVRSHGYEYPPDGFGYRGVTLKVTQGGSSVIQIRRTNVAERLYRITGEGIYRDSVLVNHPIPLANPLLDGLVTGQDTVTATQYREKLHWFWGDTNKLSYPLGNFAVSGATSDLPGRGGLDPDVGINLSYFVDESGFSKQMCRVPGPGLKWLEGVMVTRDESGKEHLVSRYASQGRISGLVVFNDDDQVFERIASFDLQTTHWSAHPFKAIVGGVDYWYIFPYLRVEDRLEALKDPNSYQAFTPLKAGTRYQKETPLLDRAWDGRLIYGWKLATDPVNEGQLRELIDRGHIEPGEEWLGLFGIESGQRVWAHHGSVFWNEYRKRWVMIIQGEPGEIWYAEADTPTGPWVYGRKVVSHESYNLYNPTQHPFFDREHFIYFEGTYTNSFSGNTDQTPRYNYNQIMYRLSLDDPRLFLPAPVYLVRGTGRGMRYLMREALESENQWNRIEEVGFFAIPPDRWREGLIPIFAAIEKGEIRLRSETNTATGDPGEPLFYGLPTEFPEELAGTWRCEAKDSDGSEIPFILELKLEGEVVRGSSPDGRLVITEGRFKEGELDLNLKDKEDKSSYSLNAALVQGRLKGEWQENDAGAMKGTWEGEQEEHRFLRRQLSSPAVVPLYEYRGKDDSDHFYSTDPQLRNGLLKRSAEPICRVWRNPMSLLILDYEAKPVLAGQLPK